MPVLQEQKPVKKNLFRAKVFFKKEEVLKHNNEKSK